MIWKQSLLCTQASEQMNMNTNPKFVATKYVHTQALITAISRCIAYFYMSSGFIDVDNAYASIMI